MRPAHPDRWRARSGRGRRRPGRSRRHATSRGAVGVPLQVERDGRRRAVGRGRARRRGRRARRRRSRWRPSTARIGASQVCSAHSPGALTSSGSARDRDVPLGDVQQRRARRATSAAQYQRAGGPSDAVPGDGARATRRLAQQANTHSSTPASGCGARRARRCRDGPRSGRLRSDAGRRADVRYLSLDWIDELSPRRRPATPSSRALAADHEIGVTQVVSDGPEGDVTYHLQVGDGEARFGAGAGRARARAHGAGLGDRRRGRHRRAQRPGGVRQRPHPAVRRPAAAARRPAGVRRPRRRVHGGPRADRVRAEAP